MKKKCLVIGAGPAGASLATWMARQGWDVCLADRRVKIEQKVCGECLSPPSYELLQDLGAWSRIPAEEIQDLAGITLFGPRGSRCPLTFGTFKPLLGEKIRPFTIARPVLDTAILDCARDAGVRVEMGTSMTQLNIRKAGEGHSIYLAKSADGRKFEADFLVGADGRQSWVARQLGLASSGRSIFKNTLKRCAVFGHFYAPDTVIQGVEMHVTPWGYVGLNPLCNGQVNTIAVMAPERLREFLKEKENTPGKGGLTGLAEILVDSVTGVSAPAGLRKRMSGSRLSSQRVRSVSPMTWIPSGRVAPSAALVGDSAGFVDPFTGEGLYHALSTSRHLASFLENEGPIEGLKSYEKWHVKVFGPEEVFCHRLQKLLPHRHLADYVIRNLGEKADLNAILSEAVADRLPPQAVLSLWFWAKVLWPFRKGEKS